MRLFCGLSLAYEVRRNIELLFQHLKPLAEINWSPPENLHITTKFIGHWPDERVGEIRDALAEIPRPGPLKVAIRGIGWFPNPRHPRVLFAGIDAPAELTELARATDRHLAEIGVKEETKPYQPHLTLARIKDNAELGAVQRAIETLPSADFGVFTAAKHLLYKSKLTPTGSIYTVEAEFAL